MNRWERMMTFYRFSHRNPVNVAIHMVFIPVIVCAALIAAAWWRFEIAGLHVSGAWVVTLAMLAFYFTLEKSLAAAYAPLAIALALIADRLAALPMPASGIIAAAGFFGGYAVQFVGHAIEGRKPALFDSIWQATLTAPLFQVAEVLSLAGMHREMFEKADAEIASRERAGAAS